MKQEYIVPLSSTKQNNEVQSVPCKRRKQDHELVSEFPCKKRKQTPDIDCDISKRFKQDDGVVLHDKATSYLSNNNSQNSNECTTLDKIQVSGRNEDSNITDPSVHIPKERNIYKENEWLQLSRKWKKRRSSRKNGSSQMIRSWKRVQLRKNTKQSIISQNMFVEKNILQDKQKLDQTTQNLHNTHKRKRSIINNIHYTEKRVQTRSMTNKQAQIQKDIIQYLFPSVIKIVVCQFLSASDTAILRCVNKTVNNEIKTVCNFQSSGTIPCSRISFLFDTIQIYDYFAYQLSSSIHTLAISVACKLNYPHVLRWIYQKKINIPMDRCFILAAKNEAYDVLDWIWGIHCIPFVLNYTVQCKAAREGNIRMFSWFKGKDITFIKQAFVNTVIYGHLETLIYMMKSQSSLYIHRTLLETAKNKGHLHIVDYLRIEV
jgi:hypothetical protein